MNKQTKRNFILVLICAFSLVICSSCSQKEDKENRIVIWTSNSEFAQYIELFNKTHKSEKAVLVYKENPALSLPPAKDELAPDIIVGSWLRNDAPQKNFKNLNYLFNNKKLTSDIFYPQLLESGKKHNIQYLLPVSYNLPAIIFANYNKNNVSDSYILSFNQIRSTAAAYNTKNAKGAYTKIGFTPLNNSDFLYLATKLNDVNFHEEKKRIVYDEEKLKQTAIALKEWVEKENGSSQIEEDFAFKYLFMPTYRQVTSDRTLFSYMTSDQLFKVMKNQNLGIDYRWIVEDKKIPIEDSFIMMGIYSKASNQIGATEFISWFFQSENQRAILERKENLNLDVEQFGIAGGFSAVRDVTEHVLPLYYTELLTNLPPAPMLSVPQKLPARWENYKDLVVESYIKGVIKEGPELAPTIADLEKEWRKKVFD